ncbi:hypothetical protein N9T16_05260 [Pelagibacteraceae bacterium]|nr:hypothetical protein [Pelagibacteraceae bacterium]
MAGIDASKLTLSTKQVQDYFNPPGPNWIVGIAIFIGVCFGFMIHAIVGFLAILGAGYWLYKRSKNDTTKIPTDDYVAIASEFQAMAHLPGVNEANIFEPEPGIVYSWGN